MAIEELGLKGLMGERVKGFWEGGVVVVCGGDWGFRFGGFGDAEVGEKL